MPGCPRDANEPVSVLLVVGLQDLGRNTAPVRNLHPLLTCPLADSLVLLPVSRSRTRCPTANRRPANGTLATASAAGVFNIVGKRIAQAVSVVSREVNLILNTVQSEREAL